MVFKKDYCMRLQLAQMLFVDKSAISGETSVIFIFRLANNQLRSFRYTEMNSTVNDVYSGKNGQGSKIR